jgi:hypothetical protein
MAYRLAYSSEFEILGPKGFSELRYFENEN